MAVRIITGTKMSSTLGYAPRTVEDGTPGTEIMLSCMFRSVNLRFARPTLDPIITLCTDAAEFADVDVGAATGAFAFNGYMAEGNVYGDPLSLITEQFAGEFTGVFGSGNTVTWDGKVTTDDNTFESRNNSARQVVGIITDTPSSDWTTT
jgi:hypothetical protein